MSFWIFVTIFAAFMQNLRFVLQKHLAGTNLSTGGVTFSRFLFAMPVAAVTLILCFLSVERGLPQVGADFYRYGMVGGVAQIVATACVVRLFSERNFIVGIALKKTEVLLTAVIGIVVLGEILTVGAGVAIFVGFIAVLLLSKPPVKDKPVHWSKAVFNKATGFGLASGLFFGISAIGYRASTLAVESEMPLVRALVTLVFVTTWQVVLMSIWLRFRAPGEITRVVCSWRVSSLVGLTSMLGSLGWFTAFTLQNAAYVKAVGQIELVFTFISSYLIFRERSTLREIGGVLLLVVSILVLILVV